MGCKAEDCVKERQKGDRMEPVSLGGLGKWGHTCRDAYLQWQSRNSLGEGELSRLCDYSADPLTDRWA